MALLPQLRLASRPPCPCHHQGGANAPTKQADKGNSFGKDIGSFLMKLIKDPSYASNLLEELKKPEEPENQVEVSDGGRRRGAMGVGPMCARGVCAGRGGGALA